MDFCLQNVLLSVIHLCFSIKKILNLKLLPVFLVWVLLFMPRKHRNK